MILRQYKEMKRRESWWFRAWDLYGPEVKFVASFFGYCVLVCALAVMAMVF